MATARVVAPTGRARAAAAHPRPRGGARPTRRRAHRAPPRATDVQTVDVQTDVMPPEAAAAAATPTPAAPQEGEEREVRLTLETSHVAGGLVRLKEGRTARNTRLVVVDSVVESGEAYRRGVRPNMVIKAMTGTSGDERTEMWELDEMVSLRYIKETIRLARYPMDFILIEGADVRPTPAEIANVVGADEATAAMTDVDLRIQRRRAYNKIDDERNDFPLVGALLALVIVPPVLVLVANSFFHWA